MVKQSAVKEQARHCYEWQAGQPRIVLGKETKGKNRYSRTWLLMAEWERQKYGPRTSSISGVRISKDRWLAEMREKRTISVDGDLKHSWGRQAYTTCCTMKEKSCIACFCLGIGKLKEGVGERGTCLLCAGEESDSHLLLLRPETRKWK